jgi:DNA-binding transcriptional LysR family regulator
VVDYGLESIPKPCRDLAMLPRREEEKDDVCPPSHPLAAQSTVRPAQLDGEKYVGFDRGLAIRRKVDRFLREHGVSVEVVLEFDNIENIKKGIEVGRGLALLPEPTLRQEVQAGTLRALRVEGGALVRPIGIIHRRRTPPGSAAQDFIDLLRGTQAPRVPSDGADVAPANGALSGAHPAGHSPQHNGGTRRKSSVP